MAKRLLARETAGVVDHAALATGLERVCTRVSANLRRSVGDDGYTALLARALRITEPEHAVLTSIRRLDGEGISLDAFAEHLASHGDQAVTAALEALLTSLIDLLGSLIGADLVWGLLADDSPLPQPDSDKESS